MMVQKKSRHGLWFWELWPIGLTSAQETLLRWVLWHVEVDIGRNWQLEKNDGQFWATINLYQEPNGDMFQLCAFPLNERIEDLGEVEHWREEIKNLRACVENVLASPVKYPKQER